MVEPERAEAVLPDRALCLPTFSHFLIVNKNSLSLARSLAHMEQSATSHEPRVEVSQSCSKDQKHAKIKGPETGDAMRFRQKLIYSNNLHVLSLKASECMCDESEPTSSSLESRHIFRILAATSSCHHSLSRPHPPSPAPHPQSSAIIRNHHQLLLVQPTTSAENKLMAAENNLMVPLAEQYA